jgi:hypothetical protein
MAIDHERSSEIAAALLSDRKREPGELQNLKETVLRVHSTLQKLTAESKQGLLLRMPEDEQPNANIRLPGIDQA